MNYYLINYLEWVIAMVLQSNYLLFAFPSKKKNSKFVQLLIVSLMQLPPLTIKYIFNDNTIVRDIMIFITAGALLAFQIIFQVGKTIKKILFLFLVLAANFLGELCAALVLSEQLANTTQLTMDMPFVFVYLVYQFIFANIFMMLLFVIWTKVLKTAIFDAKLMIGAFVLPMSQVFVLYAINSVIYAEGVSAIVQWSATVGLILSILADVYLMYMLLQEQQKKEMEKKLSQMEMQRAISVQHYEEIEKRREDFAKIRHDINNQLSAIGSLMGTGQVEKAQEMISSLGGYIAETGENRYCFDPIVNAVLTECEEKCDSYGIKTEFDIVIPGALKIEPVKICSIFSNLIRNAQAAALDYLKAGKDNSFISVHAKLNGEYLNVVVKNSCLNQQKKKTKDRKHYGVEILQQIAEEYNGYYEAKQQDELYECFVSVAN